MSSLNNLNYYKRSMNSIQSFDDGMGATMENGAIVCNSFSTDSFTANTINVTTATVTTANVTTGNITTLNSTTGNITTLNNTTGNITTLNSTTTTNSGKTTTGILETNNIETKLTTDILQITGKEFNFNGTETHTRTYLSKYLTNHILAATNNNIAYFDFFSYEFGSRRDGQIKCTGGSDTINDRGVLAMTFASIGMNVDSLSVDGPITSPTLNSISIINSGTVTTGTLASTTINNSGTTTSNILNATTSGTIPTLNSTTGNITTLNSTTINNSGTTTTGTLASTTINNSGTISCNVLNATTSGTIPTLNNTTLTTYTINGLANINSVSSQYWKTGGIVMRPYNIVPNSMSWFSMNYDNALSIEKNGLQFEVGSAGVNLIVDDNLPFTINENGVDQLKMTPSTGWTFNNKISTTYDASFSLINSNTINNTGTINSHYLNASLEGTIPTINSTTANLTYINNSGGITTGSITSGSITTTGSITKASGTLTITAPTIQLNGNVQFSSWLNTQTVGGKALNTTYQNTGTSPRFISISATNGSVSVLTAKTNAATPPTVQVAYTSLFNNVGQTIFFIVLPGNYYRVETSAGGTLQVWTEWT